MMRSVKIYEPRTADITVVIPCFNNPDITQRCVASVMLFKPKGSKVILVDNGSSDPGIRILCESWTNSNPEDFSFVRLEHNVGPYAAVNVGIKLCHSEYIAVVCNDVVVLPDTLMKLHDVLVKHFDKVQVAGACQPEPSPKCWDFFTTMATSNDYGLFDSKLVRTQGYFTCFMTTQAVFNEIGLFNEEFKLTYGDTDWEERVFEAGLTYAQFTDSVVYHGHSTTRKRLGLDEDVKIDSADHKKLIEIWKHNPRVMQKHGFKFADEDLARGTKACWDLQGEK